MPHKPTAPPLRADNNDTRHSARDAYAPAETATDSHGAWRSIFDWIALDARPYAISMLVHACVFLLLAVTLGTVAIVRSSGEAIAFTEPDPTAIQESEPEIDETPVQYVIEDPPPLIVDPNAIVDPNQSHIDDVIRDNKLGNSQVDGPPTHNPSSTPPGGSSVQFRGPGDGPLSHGGASFGPPGPANGPGTGFGQRGGDHIGTGTTRTNERAVSNALKWLSRHQNRDGSWSLDNFHQNCQYGKCSGPGSAKSDAGATALGLLPFLGAGQTHQAKCVYQRTVRSAVDWLVLHQKPDGDLSAGSSHVMYSHGLAAIALCEAYGMTQDSRIRHAAQASLRFIETAQNKTDGGWRYRPGDPGDTSVVGWQLMALKSGQMAGLDVDAATLERVGKWLDSVSTGDYSGIVRYQRDRDGYLPSMTAVGCLCREYLGAPKADPRLQEGIAYLMKNMPNRDGEQNIYYWYYATQTIHHLLDANWDKWNRNLRRILVETQVKDKGCDAGSWDSKNDLWGASGGRLMVTSLSCLTLEVYYRHLPLYKQ